MNDTLIKILYFLVAFCGVLLLFAIYNGAQEIRKLDKYKENTSYSNRKCKIYVYYFWNGNEYIKADSQKFRILFTGEVVNAYFMSGNREYSTLNYYKEFN
jgi:hypothetical protein